MKAGAGDQCGVHGYCRSSPHGPANDMFLVEPSLIWGVEPAIINVVAVPLGQNVNRAVMPATNRPL